MSSYKKSKALLDTFVTVTVVADSKAAADKAIDNAFDVIENFGDLVNFYSDKSEVSAINRNAEYKRSSIS
jgi:thiamine biosynthesis lipoprotein ApbE